MTIDLSALFAAGIKEGGAIIVAMFAIGVLYYVMKERVREQKERGDERVKEQSERLEEQKARTEEIKQDKAIMVETITTSTQARQETVAALNALTNVIERFSIVVGGCEAAQEAMRAQRENHRLK